MTIFLLLLSLSLLFPRVLTDLTDAQVAIVKQRLSEGSRARFSHPFHSSMSPISPCVTAGNSVRKHRPC